MLIGRCDCSLAANRCSLAKFTEIRDLPLSGRSSVAGLLATEMLWLLKVLWRLGAILPGSRAFCMSDLQVNIQVLIFNPYQLVKVVIHI